MLSDPDTEICERSSSTRRKRDEGMECEPVNMTRRSPLPTGTIPSVRAGSHLVLSNDNALVYTGFFIKSSSLGISKSGTVSNDCGLGESCQRQSCTGEHDHELGRVDNCDTTLVGNGERLREEGDVVRISRYVQRLERRAISTPVLAKITESVPCQTRGTTPSAPIGVSDEVG